MCPMVSDNLSFLNFYLVNYFRQQKKKIMSTIECTIAHHNEITIDTIYFIFIL